VEETREEMSPSDAVLIAGGEGGREEGREGGKEGGRIAKRDGERREGGKEGKRDEAGGGL